MTIKRTEGRYRPSREEMKQIDTMLGVALLDARVARQLVFQRSDSLLATFGLSADLRHWLMSIEAVSLEEFVRAILADRNPL
jgi:hypothetical protein